MPTFRTVTLGCKVNQYETEYVREGLARLGYREVEDGEAADLCVVNTCTVTSKGDLKSRKIIRQFARQYPDAEIVVMGCYATRAPDVVAALPGVTEVVTDKRRLPDWLARLGLVDVPTGISRFGHRHRAYVKVQDGCRMQCSYCIIPFVRPNLVSRPVDEVLDEIRRLAAGGYREMVLTGIHLGHYGVGLGGNQVGDCPNSRAAKMGLSPCKMRKVLSDRSCGGDLAHDRSENTATNLTGLVGRIMSLDGPFRLRLSSLEAAEVTPELISLVAAHPDRICPHVHVSMQSGSDAVLARMRRRETRRQFVERCMAIREALDHPAMTTDVIVGFPGETEADFEATCRAVEEVQFSKIHVFRYSPRQGTPAAKLPDQVSGRTKQRRAAVLLDLASKLRERFFKSLLGRRLQVLIESTVADQPGTLTGTSARYAPVEFHGDEGLIGQLVQVTAGSVSHGRIQADGVAVPGGQSWLSRPPVDAAL